MRIKMTKRYVIRKCIDDPEVYWEIFDTVDGVQVTTYWGCEFFDYEYAESYAESECRNLNELNEQLLCYEIAYQTLLCFEIAYQNMSEKKIDNIDCGDGPDILHQDIIGAYTK